MRGKLKRKFAVVMVSVLALSNIQTAPVFAGMEEESTIIQFEELPGKYAVQELQLGSAEEDIHLPNSLWAEMTIVKQKTEEDSENTEEQKAPVATGSEAEGTDKKEDSDDRIEKSVRRKIRDIKWELNFTESSDAEFQAEVPGTYVYEPVIPSGYEIDLEVELPQILVMVGTFDEEENGTDYAYTTPSNATPANAEFRKVPASSNLSAAEKFALFISTFDHGGSGQLTTTISNDTVTVEGCVTGATNSLIYTYKGSPDLIIDWRGRL